MGKPFCSWLSRTLRFLTERRRLEVLLAAILVSHVTLAWGQNASAPPESRPVASMADSLKHADETNTQLHIFYVHGMADAGPGYSDSEDLRKALCRFLRDCTTAGGKLDGKRE